MTKVEAIKEFRAEILPYVHAKYGRTDRIAVREAWNDWTDGLYKDRRITQHQYDTWSGPFP